MAQDLIAFTQGLVLESELATAEPKRLRYALLHTAGRLTTTVTQNDTAPPARMAVGQGSGRCLRHTSILATDHLNNVSLVKSNQHQLRDPHALGSDHQVIFDANKESSGSVGQINGGT